MLYLPNVLETKVKFLKIYCMHLFTAAVQMRAPAHALACLPVKQYKVSCQIVRTAIKRDA